MLLLSSGVLLLDRVLLLNRGVFLMARGTGCLSTAMTDVDVDLFLEALDDAVAAVAAAKIAA